MSSKRYKLRYTISLCAKGTKYMAKQRRLETIESFTDLKKCVHYCSVGGHLWVHNAPCEWLLYDKDTGKTVHKFFSVCEPHRLLEQL